MFRTIQVITPLALGVATKGDELAALIAQVSIEPDFDGFGILLNDSLAQQQDIWDDSAWNAAVNSWNNASKNFKKTQFAEVDADTEQQDIWDDSAWNAAVTNWNNASKNFKKTQFAEVGADADQQDIWDDSAWNAAVTSWNNASKNFRKTQFAEVDADAE